MRERWKERGGKGEDGEGEGTKEEREEEKIEQEVHLRIIIKEKEYKGDLGKDNSGSLSSEGISERECNACLHLYYVCINIQLIYFTNQM